MFSSPGIQKIFRVARWAIICGGLAMSLLAFTVVQNWDRQKLRSDFESDAGNRFAAIKREIESNMEVLSSVKAFFLHAKVITRSEFHDFTKPLLANHPSIQALEWAPRIPSAQRNANETATKKDGIRNYHISEYQAQGAMTKAGRRDEYFPVFYVEPYKGNEPALGFDLDSDPIRKEALELSRDSGGIAATHRMRLVQEKAEQFGFLVFSPIYRKDASVDSNEARHRNIRGFALGVFRIGNMVERALAYLNPEGIDAYLYDDSTSLEESLLYVHPSRTRKAGDTLVKNSLPEDDLTYTKTFDMAGRKWRMVFKPTPGYVARGKTWQPWIVLSAGLLLTGLLAGFVLFEDKRSEALTKSNKLLTSEVGTRKRAEEELRVRESQLRESRGAVLKEHEELRRTFNLVEVAKREWEKTMDCMDDMVILTSREGIVRRCNRSFKDFLQLRYEQVLGGNCVDLFAARGIDISDAQSPEAEVFSRVTERWFRISTYPVRGIDGDQLYGSVITLHDITTIKLMTLKLEQTNHEIEQAYSELKLTQAQILQQEKMASIGQLAAGVAHEINNPMGFISSNLGSLNKYLEKIFEYIRLVTEAAQETNNPAVDERLGIARRRLKMDFVLDDVHRLIAESLDGAERVKTIVQSLKTFSRADQGVMQNADINECIETTLNIIWNELKYKSMVKKEYGALPLTRCFPQQLNQVFMNLLVNAAHAIETQGEIMIRTWSEDGAICASVADTGCGIPADNLGRIFEPFFTTKEVGKGTGLGLSIAYDIVKKHNGEIVVRSEVGKGTTFTVRIPVLSEKVSVELPA